MKLSNKIINFEINNNTFGPLALDNKNLKIFLNDVIFFRVHHRIKIFTIDENTNIIECNEWVINICNLFRVCIRIITSKLDLILN